MKQKSTFKLCRDIGFQLSVDTETAWHSRNSRNRYFVYHICINLNSIGNCVKPMFYVRKHVRTVSTKMMSPLPYFILDICRNKRSLLHGFSRKFVDFVETGSNSFAILFGRNPVPLVFNILTFIEANCSYQFPF